MTRFTQGWFKTWRSIWNHPAGYDGYVYAVFGWLISNANLLPTKIRRRGSFIELPRGSLVSSSYEMAGALGFERKTIERRLKWLQEQGTIVLQTSHEGSIISICNYEEYQENKNVVSQECPTGGATRNPTGGATRGLRIEEEKKEEEKKEDKRAPLVLSEPPKAPPPPSALVDLWNEKAAPCLPRVKLITSDSKRYKHARARLAKIPSLAYWQAVIERINASSFCCGTNDRGWLADFEFLCGTATHEKVMEGKYDDRGGGGNKPGVSEWLEKWSKEE